MAKISIEKAKERLHLLSSQQKPSINKVRKMQNVTPSEPKSDDDIELVDVIDENIVIFKTSDGSFALSPTDDELPPIIGVFDEIPDDKSMPPCFSDWMKAYSEEVTEFQKDTEPTDDFDSNVISPIKMVDLGLSVKWGNMNVGATKVEEVGNYYAWGETATKSEYKISNYKFYNEATKTYKDLGKCISETEYDVAYKSNKNFCMPTLEQVTELVEQCKWEKITLNNVNVWQVTGPNGNKIYIPISGCISESDKVGYKNNTYFWTGNNSSASHAKVVKVTDTPILYANYKRTGVPVRPVASSEYDEKTAKFELVDLGLSVNWGNMNLGATKPQENGNYYAWGELDKKDAYTWKTYKYYNGGSSAVNIGSNISKNNEYDAAYAIDKDICMPTKQQFQELIEKCKWQKTTLNNINIWQVTGPNGKKIYFPINGCISESDKVGYTSSVYCWTSNLNDANKNQAVTFKTLENEDSTDYPGFYNMMRRTGAAIRPVASKDNTNVKKKIDTFVPYKWSQTAPFNNLLIIDPTTNKRCITGCTNTAMSMIIAYYGCIGVKGKKYRRGITATSAYTSERGTNKIDIPALEPVVEFDYDNMNFIKPSDFKTDVSKIAAATLMKHVGYSNGSNYSSSGTGCFLSKAVKTAKNKMHLASNPKMIYASNGLEKFKEQIYNELVQGFPVQLAGYNKEYTAGHSFVCDGYDPTNDWFHFNWGWSGNYNGWFNMSLLEVGGRDFNNKKEAIIGLHPEYIFGDTNDDNKIDINDVGKVVQAIIDNKPYDYRLDINSDNKIDIKDVEMLVESILGKLNF